MFEALNLTADGRVTEPKPMGVFPVVGMSRGEMLNTLALSQLAFPLAV